MFSVVMFWAWVSLLSYLLVYPVVFLFMCLVIWAVKRAAEEAELPRTFGKSFQRAVEKFMDRVFILGGSDPADWIAVGGFFGVLFWVSTFLVWAITRNSDRKYDIGVWSGEYIDGVIAVVSMASQQLAACTSWMFWPMIIVIIWKIGVVRILKWGYSIQKAVVKMEREAEK